jgi:hypothetical protein
VQKKKKFKGFPMFFTFENFKKGLFGRHEVVVKSSFSIVVVPIDVVIAVADLVSKGRGTMQMVKS